MTFGERLTELRKENGYKTRNEFAEKLGIPSTTLRNYETNVREPGHPFLIEIAELFNVSIDYLLCLTSEKDRSITSQLKSSEFEHIKKYRDLDNIGKNHIETVLNWEIKRVEQLRYSMQIETANEEKNKEQQKNRLIKYFRGGVAAGSGIYQFEEVMDNLEIPITDLTQRADFIVDVSGDSMEPLLQNNDKVLVSNEHVDIGDIGVFVKNGQAYVKKRGEKSLISLNSQREDIIVAESDDVVCYGKVIGRINFDYLNDDKIGKFAIQSLADIAEMNDVKNQLDDIFQSKIGEKTKRNA